MPSQKRHISLIKRLVIALMAAAGLFLLFMAGCYIAVSLTARGRCYDKVEMMPERNVAVVFGTSPLTVRRRENLYFKYRIQAAAELYREGKVHYFIVSGDNSTMQYNEPRAMKDSLSAHGVPYDSIYCDYAGFNTLSSVIRANKVFQQDSLIFVSQKWHNQRAVTLARANDIDALAYNARDVAFRWVSIKNLTRENFARVKMYLDIFSGRGPKFLGEPIEIGSPTDTSTVL